LDFDLDFVGLDIVKWVRLCWCLIILGAVLSPYVPFLRTVSQYGRNVEELRHSFRNARVPGARCLSRLVGPHAWFHNGAAFLTFYIVASIWSSFLLAELLGYWLTQSFLLLPLSLSVFLWNEAKYQSTLCVMILMHFQVTRRLYECLAVHKFSKQGKQHFMGFAVGVSFYILAIFTPVVRLLGELPVPSRPVPPPSSSHPFQFGWYTVKQLILIGVFFLGWYKQHRCHVILANLRSEDGERKKQRKLNYNTDKYAIPQGDWFSYVSVPHYFAEIVMYTALCCLSDFQVEQCLEWLFVVSNLGITATRTHRWYKVKFEHYPKSRKILIPFLY